MLFQVYQPVTFLLIDSGETIKVDSIKDFDYKMFEISLRAQTMVARALVCKVIEVIK